MDLRRAIGEYVAEGRDLLLRLRSADEGPTACAVDLHILRVQLYLLDMQASNMEECQRLHLLERHIKGLPRTPQKGGRS
jgi:hypothetical protein